MLSKGRGMILEVLSIVLGVLLALGVSEWNEDRVNRNKAELALQYIQAELQSNRELLAVVHQNNARIVAEITSGEVAADTNNQFVPGLQIQSTAWDAMIASGINEHVDYPLLSSLSAAYSFQEVYLSLSYQMIQNIMSATTLAAAIREDAELSDELFLENMQLVTLSEEALQQHYDTALASLLEQGVSPGEE